jgi:parvulin-like peptidyl-prolyl isomerase
MKDRLDTSFYRAALKLGKSGDISGVVKTPFGLHLIRLTGKHNWSEVDRQHVKRLILDDKRQEIVSHFLDGLRQKAKQLNADLGSITQKEIITASTTAKINHFLKGTISFKIF